MNDVVVCHLFIKSRICFVREGGEQVCCDLSHVFSKITFCVKSQRSKEMKEWTDGLLILYDSFVLMNH